MCVTVLQRLQLDFAQCAVISKKVFDLPNASVVAYFSSVLHGLIIPFI